MPKLTNVRMRLKCAYCGANGVYEFKDNEETRVALPLNASLAGWVSLEAPRMFLCPRHAETIRHATVDEVKFLAVRLEAFERATLFHLPFIVVGERLISENDERQATWAEIARWQVITGTVPFKAKGDM